MGLVPYIHTLYFQWLSAQYMDTLKPYKHRVWNHRLSDTPAPPESLTPILLFHKDADLPTLSRQRGPAMLTMALVFMNSDSISGIE